MTQTPGTGTSGAALGPLRVRYAEWLRLDAGQVVADRDEDPEQIRAIQILLRLERGEPPSWHRALALAASGCAALCLDPRAEPGGEWHEAVDTYCRGHIRKVTRRGRGAWWEATGQLPGVTLAEEGTQVRVLVPDRIATVDKRVAKLQVGGTDVPVDDPPATGGDSSALLTLWVATEPVLTAGKLMAQTGHVGMIAAALLAASDPPTLARWASAGCPAICQRIDPRGFADLATEVGDPAVGWQTGRWLAVRDAGFTEVAPGTVTVLAQAPSA